MQLQHNKLSICFTLPSLLTYQSLETTIVSLVYQTLSSLPAYDTLLTCMRIQHNEPLICFYSAPSSLLRLSTRRDDGHFHISVFSSSLLTTLPKSACKFSTIFTCFIQFFRYLWLVSYSIYKRQSLNELSSESSSLWNAILSLHVIR